MAHVNCATTFGGVTLDDPSNYISMTTKAKALAFGLGAKYYLNEELTFGANVKNLGGKLTVRTDTQNNSGYNTKDYKIEMPYDLSVGIKYNYSEDINIAIDYQQIFGNYGSYGVDLKFIRLGVSIKDESLTYYGGAVIPLKMDISGLPDYDLGAPFSPTAGLGWHNESVDLSCAFYFHPLMSIHKGTPSASLDISLTYKF